MIVIETNNLTKNFGNNKGVFDLSFKAKEGEIIGFVGPNGAGKTTTMLMLTGFIQPSSGSFKILNTQIKNYNDLLEINPHIGIMFSDISYDKSLTPLQIFKLNLSLFDINNIDQALEMATDLELEVNKPFGKLSTGNKKKVGIINSMVHNPKLLILDEPTSGLDPIMQQKFVEYLRILKSKGTTIFLSSHVLSEVENICDRIIMIKDGWMYKDDTTKNILASTLKKFILTEFDEKDIDKIKNLEFVEKVISKSEMIEVYTQSREKMIKYLTSQERFDYYIERPRLEDTFIESYISSKL